jgi:hypothetical protein
MGTIMQESGNISFSKSTQFSQLQSQPITLEDVRKVPGNEDISDTEAKQILLALRQFCSLMYQSFTQKNSLKHE